MYVSMFRLFPFRAITTEDFRKQGPSTAQVEARSEQECCAFSWFNLQLALAKQVSKDAAGPSRRSNRKNKGGSNFPSLLVCDKHPEMQRWNDFLWLARQVKSAAPVLA